MDMLEVGHASWPMNEQTVHFVMWSILKSPLLLGNDIQHMSAEVKALLSNREIIAVNQDSAGRAAKRVAKTGCTAGATDPSSYGSGDPSDQLQATQVYVGELADGKYVVALLNGCAQTQRIRLLGGHLPKKGSWTVRDIINGKDVGMTSIGAGLAVQSSGGADATIGGDGSLIVSDVGGNSIVAFVLTPAGSNTSTVTGSPGSNGTTVPGSDTPQPTTRTTPDDHGQTKACRHRHK